MKRAALLCISLILALAVSACDRLQPQPVAPTEGDVIVFAAAPLSGFQANGGQTLVGGVRLAAAEINQAGGLLGYRVVVEALDDESDSDVAVEIAEQIAARVRAASASWA
ncbi:MAG: ABC transporter substrate-binding protein [Anaerolineae bacterium]|nr:ABC transporter substrate-binding protein [Anaerolineae bacterium]